MITTVLTETARHRRVLTHYAPGEQCQAHRHAGAQISLVLAGSYVEDSLDGSRAVAGTSLSCKPAGFEHENRFGQEGALILSVHMKAGEVAVSAYTITALETRLMGARLLDRKTGTGPIAALMEEDALHGRPEADGTDPRLLAARRRLLVEPELSVAALARSMSIHPVHLARLFRKAFGRSPSRVQREVRAARAIERIVRSPLPLAEIAFDAGFADQAHMTRVVGQVSGWSPGGLRRLLAA